MSLRVVVRTVPTSRSPYSWAIIDDVTEKEIHRSGRDFRTPRHAWEAGIAALDQFRVRHQAQVRQIEGRPFRERTQLPRLRPPISDNALRKNQSNRRPASRGVRFSGCAHLAHPFAGVLPRNTPKIDHCRPAGGIVRRIPQICGILKATAHSARIAAASTDTP
jgi:hypothetical protein